MYQCVYDTATSYIGRELRKIYCLNEKTIVGEIMTKGMELLKLDETNCFTKKTKYLIMPSKEMLEKWIIEEAKKFIFCKFVLALNKDLHSPLTLAASIINKQIDSNEKLIHKITMLEFLIKKLQHVNWHYGPINLSTIDLTGIEINYPLLSNYEIDSIIYIDDNNDSGEEIIFGSNLDFMINYYLKNKETIDSKHSYDAAVELRKWSELIIDKINTMQPALQWLCQNDCDKAVVIPSIQEIIQKKWRYVNNNDDHEYDDHEYDDHDDDDESDDDDDDDDDDNHNIVDDGDDNHEDDIVDDGDDDDVHDIVDDGDDDDDDGDSVEDGDDDDMFYGLCYVDD